MPALNKLLGLGATLLPLFGKRDTEYPDCVNTPTSRGCWGDGFNISTDYEVGPAPSGKLVEYDLTLTQEKISPDGYEVEGMVFNGQYPGPTIEANWGDTIRITINNNITDDNGTSVHWHGIRQLNTNYMDGVPGITQCPTKPGASQIYEFVAHQYGTSWYHSHFSLQYTNGAHGPIWIHGPTSMDYDVDLVPMLISDWYHADAFSLYQTEIATPQAPLPDTNIINGVGDFPCNAKDPRCTGTGGHYEVTFVDGTTYKIGIVNTGSLLTYKFWIDGHNFTVAQNDFVPIHPYVVDYLVVGIGQRYDIIIEANATTTSNGSNYWIHADYCSGVPAYDSRLGIIRYDESDTRDPIDPPNSTQHLLPDCQDPAPSNLIPIVERQVGKQVNEMSEVDYLKIGLENYPNVTDDHERIQKWILANNSLLVDWENPSLEALAVNASAALLPATAPIILDYPTGEWVYFVITSNFTNSSADTQRVTSPSVHPIHLHGHDFVILAQGEGPFHKDIVPNLDNPARRDVADVTIGGYLWIAFVVDNPGSWIMHCHIAWHASAGLGLQYIEQPSKIKGLMDSAGVLPEYQEQCKEWKEWYSTVNIPSDNMEDDSGV